MFQTSLVLLVTILSFVFLAMIASAGLAKTPVPFEGIRAWKFNPSLSHKGANIKIYEFAVGEMSKRGIEFSDTAGRQIGVVSISSAHHMVQGGNATMSSISVSINRFVSVINPWGCGRIIGATVWTRTTFYLTEPIRARSTELSEAKRLVLSALDEIGSHSPSV